MYVYIYIYIHIYNVYNIYIYTNVYPRLKKPNSFIYVYKKSIYKY